MTKSKELVYAQNGNKLLKSKYEDELTYVKYFEEQLLDYLEKFEKINRTYYPKTIIDTKNIEAHFYKSVKELRKRTTPNN